MDVTRKRCLSDQQKLQALKEHLVDKVPISEVCKKHGIQPSQFYYWQKQYFDDATFDNSKGKAEQLPQLKKANKKIKHLEERLQKKDRVLAEMMEEHIRLKKNIFGED